MAAGAHIPLRFLRAAMKKGISLLKAHTPKAQTTKVLEPVYAKLPRNAKLHPALRHKIGSRWYSTSVKNLLRFAADTAPRAARPGSSVRTAVVGRLATTSPFASTLRPTLTGGAFPRTASGYSLGGGARFFSHGPPVQVVNQVSFAMRAFLNNGKDQMKSYRHSYGENKAALLAAGLVEEHATGAYIDFDLSPTWTSISPLNAPMRTLDEEFLEDVSVDIDTMISNLVAVRADIYKLSTLGGLPVSVAGFARDILRVHFRGYDAKYVESICQEAGIRRGVVHEDEPLAFGMLAPGCEFDWQSMMNGSPPHSSAYSEDGFKDAFSGDEDLECIRSRITGSSWLGEDDYFDPGGRPVVVPSPEVYPSSCSSSDVNGGLDIRMLLEECDEYRSGLNIWSR